MITNPKVTIDLINTNLQNRISWSSSQNQTFGDLSRLSIADKVSPDFSTFELNETILDDSIGYDIRNIAFMSKTQSNESCSFGNIWVQATFDTEVDLYDITLDFGVNYPRFIQIAYLDNNESVIDSEDFDDISSSVLHSNRAITGVRSIVIEYLQSYAPYQYAHLQSFIVGDNIVFDKNMITSLRLNETTSSISNTLGIDTASLEVYGKQGDNDIFNDSNIRSFIRKNQKMKFEVDVTKDGWARNIFLGYYYCDKITFYANGKFQIDCYSLLGVMDKVTYGASPFSENNKTGLDFLITIFTVLANKFGGQASDYYQIDASAMPYLSRNIVGGYIPIMSCREALHHLCFVLGLCVLDNRNSNILIKRINNYYLAQKQINADDIISDVEFENIDEVNSLKVDINRFEKSSEASQVATINDSRMFVFSSPIDVNSVTYNPSAGFVGRGSSTAIIIEYNNQPFEVQVFAKQYSTISDEYIEAKVQDPNNYGKQLDLMNSPLITKANASTIVNRWLDYQSSHLLKVKLQYIATDQQTSDIVKVRLPQGRECLGELMYQSLDVAGGMIASAEIMCSIQPN